VSFKKSQWGYDEVPDPFRSVFRFYDPFAIIDGLIGLELVYEPPDRLPDAECPLPPVLQGGNVLDRVPGKPGPPPAYLQNPAAFIVEDEWDWGLNDRPVEEPDDFTPGGT